MMTRIKRSAWVLTLWIAAGPAAAADPGIHITGGSNVGFNWTLSDGAGFRWDIAGNGTVNDGTNDAYDGGMRLRVSNSEFSWGSSGRRSKDGREIEIGPWRRGSLSIWRRIYIDPKLGYCRWIDIFQNTSGGAQNVPLQYYSNMGSSIQTVQTTSGKAAVAKKDWGLVTGSSSSSRPAVAHVFASKGSTVKPTVQYTTNSDDLYYHMSLKVPAGKTVALCFFEAQRRPASAATAFLKAFNPARELQKVPAPLRRIIVNMGTATFTFGAIELPRSESHDLTVLRDDTEQHGEIVMERYAIRTFYGPIDLPADRVVGLFVPAAADPHVHAVLTDGQVIAGELTNGPLKFRLTNGALRSLPPAKVRAITYRLSTERPAVPKASPPMVLLRGGQRLTFVEEDVDTTFHTESGDLKLQAKDLSTIFLDTPEGGLHRVIFRNGSVLSGMLVAETLKMRLELGPTLQIPRQLAEKFVFGVRGEPNSRQIELTLRNDNTLYGRIAEDTFPIKTRLGTAKLSPGEIAQVEIVEGSLDRALVKLHNGTTVRGRLTNRVLRFEIMPGPTLPIFVGHITRIVCPAANGKRPVTRPTPAAIAPPVPSVGPRARLAELKARAAVLRKLRAVEAAKAAKARDDEVAAKARALRRRATTRPAARPTTRPATRPAR